MSRTVEVILTHDCNFSCRYCWQRPIIAERTDESVSAQIKEVLKQVRSTPRGHITLVHFTGGEPLLRWQQLQEICHAVQVYSQAHQHRIAFAITTNASLLDEDIARWCADLKVQLRVSLDGPATAHDIARVYPDGRPTFEDTMRGIQVWKAANPEEASLSLRATLHGGTRDHLADIYGALAELRSGEVSFGFCWTGPADWKIGSDDALRFEDQWTDLCEEYLSYLKKGYRHSLQPVGVYLAWAFVPGREFTRCGVASGRHSTILPNGSLESCYNMVLVGPSSAAVGPDPCGRCWARNACGGPCPADGTPDLLSCSLIRSLIERTATWVAKLHERDREVLVSALMTR